ncbi:putative ABC transport system ATP-binding protein/putative hydroxymethylpyrimidine transport system ATP-binding protein [Frigoribacterium sp. PhB24]|nr:putative ABC transport system ATP-binding protein/putative hydroxymethylpyrimidine transport system ATP-binding protein [Frigoribacterium sp. PhB24]
MHVVIEDVGFSYRNRHVFSGLQAIFHENEVTALVGPSGSGKSSLLAAIAGFTEPTQGAIWLVANDDRLRPRPAAVSWIAQGAIVLNARTSLDNVLLGPLSEGKTHEEAVELGMRALDDVGLSERAGSLCSTLSGGERQRVAVARSLASSRPLILADEPSAGLDEANTRGLSHLFTTLRRTATVIIATHDPVMIDAADDVINLRSSTR